MKDLKGSQTEKNLMKAFAGESQARNRYTYFASIAKREGYVQVSAIFEETANQEKEHAKRLFKFMTGGETEITDAFPFGPMGSTVENLRASAAGEHHEHSSMYPSFAVVAREEGFDDIADVFAAIAEAEKGHETRYLTLAENIDKGSVFKKDAPIVWCCRNCGYLHSGAEAVEKCPACAHSRAHFEVYSRNW
jgi:rubrerythrin